MVPVKFWFYWLPGFWSEGCQDRGRMKKNNPEQIHENCDRFEKLIFVLAFCRTQIENNIPGLSISDTSFQISKKLILISKTLIILELMPDEFQAVSQGE